MAEEFGSSDPAVQDRLKIGAAYVSDRAILGTHLHITDRRVVDGTYEEMT